MTVPSASCDRWPSIMPSHSASDAFDVCMGRFAGADDLVFDIGAHAGNRVRAFAALGCHVVALEPQPDFAWLLRALYGRSPRVVIVEAGGRRCRRSTAACRSASARQP